MKDRSPLLLGSHGESLREAFGKALVKFAPSINNFVLLDADIAGGTGTHHFRKSFPERFLQFGIAEQNMMAVAGGIAATGLIPIVSTFAVFMLRAIEQARLSIAYPRMNVKLVASHPGLDVGPDGASAQCLEDLAAYRAIPNMVVISPCDPLEMELATRAILEYEGPVYMRTGRSASVSFLKEGHTFEIGKGQILREGKDITVIGCGATTYRAVEAANTLQKQGISVRVVNMPTLKPIDKNLIIQCARETGNIITVEDHNIYGGLGSAVAEVISQEYPVSLKILGVNDRFGESGDPDDLARKYGIDAESIVKEIIKIKSKS